MSGHFKLFADFSDSLVSSLRVRRNFYIIKVPGYFSKSDGTFSPEKCPVILSSLHFFSDSFGKLFAVRNFSMIKVPGHFKFFAIIISSLRVRRYFSQ